MNKVMVFFYIKIAKALKQMKLNKCTCFKKKVQTIKK
jgi:hypothetical protein